jgi:glyoxylase-like metal-dependent hydrolase (beta-lactamase superfamily II)
MMNTYLVNEEQIFVVDPGSEGNVRLLCWYVQHILQRPMHDIDLIVLTHGNPDPGTAVETLQNVCHAPIAASTGFQQLLAERRARRSASPLSQMTKRLRPGPLQYLDRSQPDHEHRARQITLWLHDMEGLPGHLDWRVITSPAHSPESLCLYNPFTRELLCGDSVLTVRRGAPIVRNSTNPAQLEETLQTLRSLPVSYLYPGHGRAILSHHPFANLDIEW